MRKSKSVKNSKSFKGFTTTILPWKCQRKYSVIILPLKNTLSTALIAADVLTEETIHLFHDELPIISREKSAATLFKRVNMYLKALVNTLPYLEEFRKMFKARGWTSFKGNSQ